MIKKVWLISWCNKSLEYFDYQILDIKHQPTELMYYLMKKDFIVLYNGIIDMEVRNGNRKNN